MILSFWRARKRQPAINTNRNYSLRTRAPDTVEKVSLQVIRAPRFQYERDGKSGQRQKVKFQSLWLMLWHDPGNVPTCDLGAHPCRLIGADALALEYN